MSSQYRRRLRHGTALAGLFLMGVAVAFPKGRPITKDRIELPTEYGKFILQDLSLTQDAYSVSFSGTISNNTDRNWAVVFLNLEFLDKSGTAMPPQEGALNTVVIPNLQKGASEPVSATIPWQITYRPFHAPTGRIADFDVIYDKERSRYDLLYVFALAKPRESDNLAYEDDSIRIAFTVVKTQVQFSLQNKTESAIEINWDQAAFIDFSGLSHRVIHTGIKLNDRDKPQAPATVPPTARIEDIVYPADYAEWSGSDWLRKPVVPPAELAYKGQTFSVFMPLKINGEVKNYLFTIKVADVLI
ncbi:MAG: hypothetical protein ABSA70_11685 [Terriglobia bacterium]